MIDNIKELQQKKLESDIKTIVNRLLKELPVAPEAIFLCGGYGRGEGAWYVNEKGEISPYNDYDVLIITEKPLPSAETNVIRKELAKEIGINWVDIDYYTRAKLAKLKTTINNVDLIYGSTCIYGNEKVLEVCPKLDSSKIGLFDVLFLYQTRIWTFLGAWEGDFHDLDAQQSIFFKNQMAKATLSVCDLILIKNHSYHTSYRKRADLVCEIKKDDSILCNRVRWAIAEKLHPTQTLLSKDEMKQLYYEVKDLFLKALSDALGRHWNSFENPSRTKCWFYTHTKQLIIEMYILLRYQNRNAMRALDIFIAQTSVFLADDHGSIKEDYLNKAKEILKKWGYITRTDYDWNVLHKVVAEARNNIKVVE